ncbi:MAG TPA: ribosome-associated translation inhibitor RaiA [Syntrophorhabdales bacterium]|nr:ribosome-associated translation inhibitor RaiA [Syntrophorhabdales bacterium]
MDLSISFRHVTPDETLKRYVEEKLVRLQKYVETPLDVHVVLSIERTYRQRIDVMFTLNGAVINAHEVMDDMYAAVDRIVDKLEVRLKRFREKIKRYREAKPQFVGAAPEEESAKIFVTKPVDAKPMDPEEAAMQLAASGNNFIIFRGIERGNVCVMYKRKDGNYGLIETAGRIS